MIETEPPTKRKLENQNTEQQSLKKKEAMRGVLVQSRSSTSEEENRDSSCYFPGCKKNANCKCEICLASINATLDLVHKSSLTNISSSRPNIDSTPISFDDSILSTPTSTASHNISSTPVIKSSARSRLTLEMENQNKEKKWGFSCSNFLKLLLGLGLLLCADVVFRWVVSGIVQPSLSPDLVKRVGEKCCQFHDLNAKLRFLQQELSIAVGDVSNCSFTDTLWEIRQDGLLLNSRCTLYKSAIEEVTIWGWPLQTAGLLTTGFSFREFTILSGRVTEWKDGQVGYLIRKSNTSWVQPKWGASAVQLDPNTWILEYQRSSFFYDPSFFAAALEFLKYRISRIIGRMKRDFWLFAPFGDNLYNGFASDYGLKIPT